jgi:large subunit ribosomal protein L4
MSTLKVLDLKGATTGEVEVPDALLCLKRGEQAVHDAVVAHLAACRSGNASTLQKGEVAGSNRKPWRQKGTGRARAGYRQSPVWRGGGIVFGPKPRDYRLGQNHKVARLAFRRALSERIASGEIRVLETIALSEAKTRAMAAALKAVGAARGALILTDRMDETLKRTTRNLPGVEVALAKDVGVYALLRHPVVLVTRSALDVLKGRLEGATEKDA